MESIDTNLGGAPPEMPKISPPNVWLRLFVFIFIGFVSLTGIGLVLYGWAGTLVTGIAASFGAAALANGITLRIYERGRLDDIGLDFSPASFKNLGWGFLGGLGSALIVAAIPLLTGMATLEQTVPQTHLASSFAFVALGLFFGAVGEEMLFRGYGFQILLKRWGPFATVLPTSVIFAWAHAENPDAHWLALVNTFAWGVLLGLCFLRSGDLWLPIGVHFGWNFTLPLFGVNLSGHTMSVSGYTMNWNAGPIWSGGSYGLEGSILTLLILPVAGFYLWKAPIAVRRPFLLNDAEEGP